MGSSLLFTVRRDPAGRADNCVDIPPQKGPYLAFPSRPDQIGESNGKRRQSSDKKRRNINQCCRGLICITVVRLVTRPLHHPSSLVSLPSFHSTSRHSDHSSVRSSVRPFLRSEERRRKEGASLSQRLSRITQCFSLSLSLCQEIALPKGWLTENAAQSAKYSSSTTIRVVEETALLPPYMTGSAIQRITATRKTPFWTRLCQGGYTCLAI